MNNCFQIDNGTLASFPTNEDLKAVITKLEEDKDSKLEWYSIGLIQRQTGQ